MIFHCSLGCGVDVPLHTGPCIGTLIHGLPVWHQTFLLATRLWLTVATVTGADWPALWVPALICSITTIDLGSQWALAAIPRLGCWSHLCPVRWGSPALLTELSSTPHPGGNCQPFLIPDPREVSVERRFFGKTHLGVKHFLKYQHSTTKACGLGDILSAYWGRWHCASKLCLPSYLQCGKCVITNSSVAKLISIPAMGCDVSQLSRLARQELLSSLRKGCLGIWGFISCLLFSSSSVFCCSQQVALYCDVCNLPGPEEKPFFFFFCGILAKQVSWKIWGTCDCSRLARKDHDRCINRAEVITIINRQGEMAPLRVRTRLRKKKSSG